MGFKVTRADGKSVIIQDFAKEIIGGLNLLGYGFANYSDEIAQNFIKDLENNAGPTEPANPVLGQLWFQIPLNPAESSNLKLCTNASASSLDTRWVNILSVIGGAVVLDAWTVRGKSPVNPGGGSNGVGQLVVLDANGKVNAAYLPSQVTQNRVDAADRLTNVRVIGTRTGPNSLGNGSVGYPFDGTADCFVNTDYIAEGNDPNHGKYFTNDRARRAISASGAISYDANTGVISYNPPPSSAAVNSFNGRSGVVGLTQKDTLDSLGYTPANRAGEAFTGDISAPNIYTNILTAQTPNGGTTGGIRLKGHPETGMAYLQIVNDAINQQWGAMGFRNDGWLSWNGQSIWHAGNDGANTGLDADLLDGKHAQDIIDAARSGLGTGTGTGISSSGDNWVIYGNGYKVCWGITYTAGNSYTYINYPFTYNSTPALVVSGCTQTGNDSKDNWPATYHPYCSSSRGCTKTAGDDAGNFHWIAMGF